MNIVSLWTALFYLLAFYAAFNPCYSRYKPNDMILLEQGDAMLAKSSDRAQRRDG